MTGMAMSEQEDKNSKDIDPIGYMAAQMIVAAFTAAGIAALAFLAFFWQWPLGGPDAWGTFGEYFGGVVGALVAVATAGLVFLTLQATRREARETRVMMGAQLELLERQQKLTDLHRRLDGLYAVWRELTTAKYTGIVGGGKDVALEQAEDQTLEVIFASEEFRRAAVAYGELPGQEDVPVKIQSAFGEAASILTELDVTLEMYDRLSPNPNLTDFYRLRTWKAAVFLCAWGLVDAETRERFEHGNVRLDAARVAHFNCA